MPNHCYQQVHLRGPRNLIKEIYEHLKRTEPMFCQLIKPMPFEMFVKPRVKRMIEFVDTTDYLNHLKTHKETSVPAWYDWRSENWGTKWEVCDVQFTEEKLTDLGDPLEDDCEAEFGFHCWTAWGPPIPVWNVLVDLGISVDADYQDEGGLFEGRYVDGDDESWEPELDEEEAENA